MSNFGSVYMKHFLLLFSIIPLALFSGIDDAEALSCAPYALGKIFDDSEYVFHGKVVEKNYMTWDSDAPMVTFDVINSFKGNSNQQITVSVQERWDYLFEDGFEYVVFVKRDGISLLVPSCYPKFMAFPSTLEILSKLSLDDKLRSETVTVFYDSLSTQEREEFEKNKSIIQEKRLERWDSVTISRQYTIIAMIVLIPVAGLSVFFILRKRK